MGPFLPPDPEAATGATMAIVMPMKLWKHQYFGRQNTSAENGTFGEMLFSCQDICSSTSTLLS